MQSFKLHLVSDQLKDRFPYLDSPFKERYDPSEVYHAVFDREIVKLVEILKMPDLDDSKYRDAIITLNEMCSHQENKKIMISQELCQIASFYTQHKQIEIRREAVLLLGSLISVELGRQNLNEQTYEGIKSMLYENEIYSREAVSWCILRLSTSRSGVEILIKQKIVKTMISAFLKYTENPEVNDAKYLIFLLESFVNILQFDEGIQDFIGTGILKRWNELLKNQNESELMQEYNERLNYLLLQCLARISVNMDGKDEAIQQQVIKTANSFLDSKVSAEINYAIIVTLNCVIHLEGKVQASQQKDDLIIKRLIELLDQKYVEFRTNVKQTLVNIAELPIGLLIITRLLSKSIPFLEEIIGFRAVIPLSQLLPSARQLENPPFIPQNDIQQYKQYCLALCFFIKKYEQAITLAIEECVKIVQKMIPFLIYKAEKQLQDAVALAIFKICQIDEFSRESLCRYLNDYGDHEYNHSRTSLNLELQKHNKLFEFLEKKTFFQ